MYLKREGYQIHTDPADMSAGLGTFEAERWELSLSYSRQTRGIWRSISGWRMRRSIYLGPTIIRRYPRAVMILLKVLINIPVFK